MNTSAIDTLHDQAKVWIYQSDRRLSNEEVVALKPILTDFAKQWASHNQDLKSLSEIYYNRFVVLMVDESQNMASGCSIDASVHFMQHLGSQLNIDFFNRLQFAYLKDDQVHLVSKNAFKEKFSEEVFDLDTLFFNNLVKTKSEFKEKWLVPLKDSWHRRFL